MRIPKLVLFKIFGNIVFMLTLLFEYICDADICMYMYIYEFKDNDILFLYILLWNFYDTIIT